MDDEPAQTTRYAVDRDDVVTRVDDAWLEFARRNEAPELDRESVVGRSLWSFVEGESTRRAWQLVFERVREQGLTASVPFRCDSPDRFRFMEMRLAPGPDGVVELEAVVLREQPRPRHLRLLERDEPRMGYAFPICSFCKRVFAFGAWLEAEVAVERLGLVEGSPAVRLEQALCGDCEEQCGHAEAPPPS